MASPVLLPLTLVRCSFFLHCHLFFPGHSVQLIPFFPGLKDALFNSYLIQDASYLLFGLLVIFLSVRFTIENVVHWRWHRHDYSHEQVWIFTGSLTVTLASVSAIGAALALAYFTCEQHHDDYVIGDDNNVTQCHLVMIIMSMSLADDNNVTQCHSMSLCRHFRPQPAILPLHECPRGCDCSWCVSEEYLW